MMGHTRKKVWPALRTDVLSGRCCTNRELSDSETWTEKTHSIPRTTPVQLRVVVMLISSDFEGINHMAEKNQFMPRAPRVKPILNVVPNSSRFTPTSPTSLISSSSKSSPWDINMIPVSSPDREEFSLQLSCLSAVGRIPKGLSDVRRSFTWGRRPTRTSMVACSFLVRKSFRVKEALRVGRKKRGAPKDPTALIVKAFKPSW